MLYRTNGQSCGFETEFLRRNIPYRVVGSLKFYEREEIKDALALLAFLVNQKDEIAFRRVVNKPTRGVGTATLGRVVGEATTDPESIGDLLAAAQRILLNLPAKARSGLETFLQALKSGRAALVSGEVAALEALEEQEEKKVPKKLERTSKKASASKKDRETRKRERLNAGEGLSACIIALIKGRGY